MDPTWLHTLPSAKDGNNKNLLEYQSQRGIFKLVDIEGFLKLVLLRSLGAVHYRIMEISDIRLWQLDIGILGYWVPATADIGADIDWLRQG